jgi:hypothetical protein
MIMCFLIRIDSRFEIPLMKMSVRMMRKVGRPLRVSVAVVRGATVNYPLISPDRCTGLMYCADMTECEGCCMDGVSKVAATDEVAI